MSELGRLLAEARNVQGVSLEDAEIATRVRQKYLAALEQGNYAALPPSAIARGFLHNYARYLGLDPYQALDLYGSESGDRGVAASMPAPAQLRPVDYRPIEVPLIDEDGARLRGWWRWILALVLVAAAAGGGWWLLNNGDWLQTNMPRNLLAAFGPQPTATMTATATRAFATVTPPVEPATPADQQPILALPTDVAPGPTPTSDLLTLPIPTTQPTVTPTATAAPTFTPEPSYGISLTITITQRSWTKVTADGQVVMQELLEAGAEKGWEANQRISVLTGNAAGVTVSINGQSLGSMGGVGQVVERTWSLDESGNIAETVGSQTPGPAGAAAPRPTGTPTPQP
jgi:cytoskeleton protein RodZ